MVSRADVTVAMVTNCRCQELEEQLGRQEEELKIVSEQLLMAVQQKFKLQQQIEAWQVRTRSAKNYSGVFLFQTFGPFDSVWNRMVHCSVFLLYGTWGVYEQARDIQ